MSNSIRLPMRLAASATQYPFFGPYGLPFHHG